MDVIWDGITRSETLTPEAAEVRQKLATAAKNYDWPHTIEVLGEHPQLINSCRPDSSSFYAPLHQAAHGGAPIEVVQRMLELGAWRTLQNARGERPVDVASRKGHRHLLLLLEPSFKRQVPLGILLKIQHHFHAVIRGRANKFVEEHALRLPELEPLLEMEHPKVWFAVPGMYGGFGYWLDEAGVNAKLITKSWCRVVGGSGQRHEITSAGSSLVEKGFV
jgi:hypothetical protein